jgi:hypothetical protein
MKTNEQCMHACSYLTAEIIQNTFLHHSWKNSLVVSCWFLIRVEGSTCTPSIHCRSFLLYIGICWLVFVCIDGAWKLAWLTDSSTQYSSSILDHFPIFSTKTCRRLRVEDSICIPSIHCRSYLLYIGICWLVFVCIDGAWKLACLTDWLVNTIFEFHPGPFSQFLDEDM